MRKHDWVFPNKIESGKHKGKYKLIEFISETRHRLWPIAKDGNKPMLFDSYKQAGEYRDTH